MSERPITFCIMPIEKFYDRVYAWILYSDGTTFAPCTFANAADAVEYIHDLYCNAQQVDTATFESMRKK